jgi:hypothetical protein
VALVLAVLLGADALIVGLITGAMVSPVVGVIAGLAAAVAPLLLGSLVIGMINLISGWAALARAYPWRAPASDAERCLAPSIAIRWRWFGYSLCVRWAADGEGLHLSMIPIFGLLTPGISIPWQDLDFDEGASMEMVRCETARGIRVWVPRKAVEREAARRRSLAVLQIQEAASARYDC